MKTSTPNASVFCGHSLLVIERSSLIDFGSSKCVAGRLESVVDDTDRHLHFRPCKLGTQLKNYEKGEGSAEMPFVKSFAD